MRDDARDIPRDLKRLINGVNTACGTVGHFPSIYKTLYTVILKMSVL